MVRPPRSDAHGGDPGSVLGRPVTIKQVRGAPVDAQTEATVFVTVHPSSILRVYPPDREPAMRAFVADLETAAAALRP